ncbi:MAG: hypothetical protein Q9184_000470 [Pyrenodesmia sp. 2 TL-2023]
MVSYLLPVHSKSRDRDGGSKPEDFTMSIERLQKATIVHASAIPGRTLWDLLVKKLWTITSLDALHTFFDDLPSLLEKPTEEGVSQGGLDSQRPKRMLLSRNSPLGAFVRRAQLEFTRLQFHDGVSLWEDLIAFRRPTLALWKRRNPGAGSGSFDTNLQEDSTDYKLAGLVYGHLSYNTPQHVQTSTEDMERLLDYQISRMQHILRLKGLVDHGDRVPEEVKLQLRKMAKPGTSIPDVTYYMQFLEAWKCGDYPSSFDKLHRYFDYAMQMGEKGLYQYALLNLAILHADFGCVSEAIIAIQETIAQAREKHDLPCLNYSLSWLQQFGRTHPKDIAEVQEKGVLGSEKEALSFLKAKAKESNMWTLLSTTLLSEAKLILSKGDSVSQAFESIVKASHLSITKDTAETNGSQLLMQSSIFERLGIHCQAWIYSELFVQYYTQHAPTIDALQSQCTSAHTLARMGRYNAALTRMEEADQETLCSLKYQQIWTANLGILKLRRHLYRDELDAADHVLAQLQAAPTGIQELHFSISFIEIDLLLRRKDFSHALTLLDVFLTDLNQQEADIFQRLKVMVLKARIYDKAGIPQKGFSVALRAASLAHKAWLLPMLWEAVGAICKILISIKEFDAAVRLLESVLPQALECEDCEATALLFSCLADGHMGLAGQAKAGSSQRKERLTKASESLDRAFDECSSIEDIRGQCEMLAKKATIMHLNGDTVLANDCAAKYLDIKKAARERD